MLLKWSPKRGYLRYIYKTKDAEHVIMHPYDKAIDWVAKIENVIKNEGEIVSIEYSYIEGMTPFAVFRLLQEAIA